MGFYAPKTNVYDIGIVNNDSALITTVTASTTTTVKTISGVGVFYWFQIITVAKADVHLLKPYVELDGYNVNSYQWGLADMNTDGFDGKPTAPLRLVEYNVDGICVLEFYHPQGLPFSQSCLLKVTNPDADDHQIRYQMLTTMLQ